MLFDGALRFMSAAAQGFEQSDFLQRNLTIHNNLVKAQAIITELQGSLDMERGGDFAQTMNRLYDYMHAQLQNANLKKDPQPISVAEEIMSEIRDAWAAMLEQAVPITPEGRLTVAC